MNSTHFAVITVSDTCHENSSLDYSGPKLVKLLKETYGVTSVYTRIVPDEEYEINFELTELIAGRHNEPYTDVIITTGGTGFGQRDVTPEATKPLIERDCQHLSTLLMITSLKKTKFAALNRGICGIAKNTLILNFPGSEKAVSECFAAISDIIPHAIQLIKNDLQMVRQIHSEVQQHQHQTIQNLNENLANGSDRRTEHVCPHRTGAGDDTDRNSPYPMIDVNSALQIIYEKVQQNVELKNFLNNFKSPINIPPFRASIKDGYAMKGRSLSGIKHVISSISAGDDIIMEDFLEDECFKINTGAPIPHNADCVIQVEDTKLLLVGKNGDEQLVKMMEEPKLNLDIRLIGSDLAKGENVFPIADHSNVVLNSLLASVGQTLKYNKPKIVIFSTGSELMDVNSKVHPGKIYDSNTTMLEFLCKYFEFPIISKKVLCDDQQIIEENLRSALIMNNIIIMSGGVSMGDKDYVKPILKKLGFDIHFGRVNMKPGKPMTFASKNQQFVFALPGNPVSAFVCFHIFILPALRWKYGFKREKCELAKLNVQLENDSIDLDPRPEYVRATVTNRNGQLYAKVIGSQMSSRLQSIVGADVLIHLPGRTTEKKCALQGESYLSSILRYDFISKYE